MKYWQVKNSLYKNPHDYFNNQRRKNIFILVILIVVTYLASIIIEFDFLIIFKNFTKAISRFVNLYLPPNFTSIGDVIEAIWVTIILSIAAGAIGTILAYFSAIATSKMTGKNKILSGILRTLATFIRNVPAAIWAIVLLMAFWFGEFLALIVMTLGNYGFTARVFSDMIDETNHHSIEALEATGASYWQIITQSVFPETLPVAISWSLYAVETNIRSATIIGMLAGGGIGHLIGIFKHFRRFDQLTVAVIFVVIVILAFDQLSSQIRKRILL